MVGCRSFGALGRGLSNVHVRQGRLISFHGSTRCGGPIKALRVAFTGPSAELDAKRAIVSSNIHEAELRLAALKQTQQFTPLPPVDADEELQLRATVVQMKGHLQGSKPTLVDGLSTQARVQTKRFRPYFVEDLARRIGCLLEGAQVPRAIRQRWSPFNVPLMWGAASLDVSTPVLDWLALQASSVTVPVEFHGGSSHASSAVMEGWKALREVFRAWGIWSREHLSYLLGRQSHGRHQATTSRFAPPSEGMGATASEHMEGPPERAAPPD